MFGVGCTGCELPSRLDSRDGTPVLEFPSENASRYAAREEFPRQGWGRGYESRIGPVPEWGPMGRSISLAKLKNRLPGVKSLLH